ncbi:Imm8 family immunity protein [Paenibacillus hunanensis]|uniref:Imm8 family immunity protein n=1 Tax=Paenibacillus hunanensis TaxID=539262 RepID=UPI002A69EED9|nr:Imm8 family immunity protein [Paenibacillus hunanensis]WPP41197.1 Imm8 family immunity protein [Paenibacillus hunanensis]
MKKKKSTPLKLQVKYYHSPDIDHIEQWMPDNDNVYYHLEMAIGLQDEQRADLYFVIIATPAGLAEARQRHSSLKSATHTRMIVLDHYAWKDVVARIESVLDSITILDRQDSLDELLHHFNWEYERNNATNED